jgi:hypothetical protein
MTISQEEATAAPNEKAMVAPKKKVTAAKAGKATENPKRGRPKGSKNKQKDAKAYL